MKKNRTSCQLSDVKLEYLKKYLVGKTILDVGAGYCYYGQWLKSSNEGLSITCLDKLDIESPPGLTFINTDLEAPLPLESNSFDTILAFDIIEHITHEEKLFKEIHRVCAPSGIVIGSVPHDDDKFLPAYNLTFYHRSDVTHKRYYEPKMLCNSLEKNGFNVIKIDLRGGVSPQVFAEFFPQSSQFVVKKIIGLLRRMHVIKTAMLASDIFFVAQKR